MASFQRMACFQRKNFEPPVVPPPPCCTSPAGFSAKSGCTPGGRAWESSILDASSFPLVSPTMSWGKILNKMGAKKILDASCFPKSILTVPKKNPVSENPPLFLFLHVCFLYGSKQLFFNMLGSCCHQSETSRLSSTESRRSCPTLPLETPLPTPARMPQTNCNVSTPMYISCANI